MYKYTDNIEVILAVWIVWKYISARMEWKQELLSICVKVSIWTHICFNYLHIAY